MRRLIFLLACLLLGVIIAQAQELPLCSERAHSLDQPWVDGSLFCLEEVIYDNSAGELAFTALATSPDGTLYATRPYTGQVLALEDTDGDQLPDTPHVIVQGLSLPNGLAFYQNALYISSNSHVYRLVGQTIETLVDNLPSGEGFWTGGLTIGPDERLYIATGAPCDFCVPTDPRRGAILSFTLEGSDLQIVAEGLRHPADVAFLNGALWTVDTARDGLFDSPSLDELNRVAPGAHFGWPNCIGSDNISDSVTEAFECANATPPALSFPTHSTPMGLAAYTSDTFPSLTGRLLVVLSGSYNEVELRGYAIAAVSFDGNDNPTSYDIIQPAKAHREGRPDISYDTIQYSGAGFWPHRPLDVAVNSQGWVYISISGGRILALRPH